MNHSGKRCNYRFYSLKKFPPCHILDPYAPTRVQASLFENLGRGADRTWSIIADADHAVHLLDDGRDRFVNIVTSFVENSKKGEKLF